MSINQTGTPDNSGSLAAAQGTTSAATIAASAAAARAAEHLTVPTCVLGLGLIGGSMMRDLRNAGLECFGWNRSPATVEAAVAEGFDASTDLAEVLTRAERAGALIVIGTPMTVVGKMLDEIEKYAPNCGITDVVSVKGAIADEVNARGMQDRFVGAHPMAGSAQAGWSASVEGLYVGAPWVLAYDFADECERAGREIPARWIEVFTQVAALGTVLGSQLIPATSARHDDAVARISHMPHLAAYAVALAGSNGGDLAISLAAGSFRDGTRVAAAEPHMVMSWCENNVEPVLDALDDAIASLTAARKQLAEEKTALDLAEKGHSARAHYEGRPEPRKIFQLRIGEGDWVNQLRLAENVGGQVEVF